MVNYSVEWKMIWLTLKIFSFLVLCAPHNAAMKYVCDSYASSVLFEWIRSIAGSPPWHGISILSLSNFWMTLELLNAQMTVNGGWPKIKMNFMAVKVWKSSETKKCGAISYVIVQITAL